MALLRKLPIKACVKIQSIWLDQVETKGCWRVQTWLKTPFKSVQYALLCWGNGQASISSEWPVAQACSWQLVQALHSEAPVLSQRCAIQDLTSSTKWPHNSSKPLVFFNKRVFCRWLFPPKMAKVPYLGFAPISVLFPLCNSNRRGSQWTCQCLILLTGFRWLISPYNTIYTCIMVHSISPPIACLHTSYRYWPTKPIKIHWCSDGTLTSQASQVLCWPPFVCVKSWNPMIPCPNNSLRAPFGFRNIMLIWDGM